MKQYLATIRHHSIARARTITINGDLIAAKRAVDAEFGDEQRDCVIYIENANGQPAAYRKLSSKRYRNY